MPGRNGDGKGASPCGPPPKPTTLSHHDINVRQTPMGGGAFSKIPGQSPKEPSAAQTRKAPETVTTERGLRRQDNEVP